jgi:hypothetical protein
MAALTNAANGENTLANLEPSTHGTFWNWGNLWIDSVMRCEPNIGSRCD